MNGFFFLLTDYQRYKKILERPSWDVDFIKTKFFTLLNIQGKKSLSKKNDFLVL
jgi:hypothetical protein